MKEFLLGEPKPQVSGRADYMQDAGHSGGLYQVVAEKLLHPPTVIIRFDQNPYTE